MRRVLAILTSAVLASLNLAHAAETHTRAHVISAPRGFFLGELALLTQDHHLAGFAIVLVVQDGGTVTETGRSTTGSWYEVAISDMRPRGDDPYPGDQHYVGKIPSPDDVHISPGESGHVRVPLGDFGVAELQFLPTSAAYDRCCMATLFTRGTGYTNLSTGAHDELAANVVLHAWQSVDVEGIADDVIVTNNVPADVEHIGGIHIDSEIALAANGVSTYTTNIEGSDHEGPGPNLVPSTGPTTGGPCPLFPC